MRPSESARWDYLEWVTAGDCPCCFPYWKYLGVSKQDIWRWDEDEDIKAWRKFYDEMTEEETEVFYDEGI